MTLLDQRPRATPATRAPDLSIIIVSWNTRDLLARALGCLYESIHNYSYEVLVVDNGSTDGSPGMLVELFPDARLIVNDENLGFSRANNQAARLARGRYLLLLNSDAFVHPNAVDRLIDFMDTHPAAGAAGCRLYYEDGTLQRSCTAFPTLATELWTMLWLDKLFPHHSIFGRYQMTYWAMDDLREVDSLMGACLMLRRAAIDTDALFDERFFMYSEEVDLCFRLKQAGWRLYFVPDAEATHIWGGSARQVQKETFLRMYRSRVQFFRKYYGRGVALLLKAMLSLSSLLRIIAGSAMLMIKHRSDTAGQLQNYHLLLRAVWFF